MKIAVIHDYADVFRGTRAYPRLKDHEVIIHTDAYTDPAACDRASRGVRRVSCSRSSACL